MKTKAEKLAAAMADPEVQKVLKQLAEELKNERRTRQHRGSN